MTEKASEFTEADVSSLREVGFDNILKVLDVLNPPPREGEPNLKEQQEVQKIVDIHGGFGRVDATVNKNCFVIYGGIDREYNLKVESPCVIVTYGGIRNNYRMSREVGNKEKTFFVTYGGIDNKYSGNKVITFEQFRKLAVNTS